ncbi:hypothetical protein [Arenibaculum sp.]|jgi:hypothetical protein|uniref:hypothetical protein n=1 Tax=Arenibaculum sp. TaxID=2865862 RepID=UPI002E14D15E|nr:hypothetical protein [Arenibaculum sp.]
MAEFPTPEISVVYELHTRDGDGWTLAAEACDPDSLVRMAAGVLRDGAKGGGRVVRCWRFPEYDHAERTVLHAWPRAAAGEAVSGRDGGAEGAAPCLSVDDLYAEPARAAIAVHLARFLEPRRLTPVELLHSTRSAGELTTHHAMLEGAVQRAAMSQVAGTGMRANRRQLELMDLVHAAFARLSAIERQTPLTAVEGRGLAAVAAGIEASCGAQAPFHLMRALAAHLGDAPTWTAKLGRIGDLVGDGLAVRHYRLLDTVAAEIVRSPAALRELAGAQRAEAVLATLVALHAGRPPGPPGGDAAALARFAAMVGAGLAPRTRTGLRLRLLEELHRPTQLRPGEDLFQELDALDGLARSMAEHSPALARDEEIREAIELRAGRALQSDRLDATLAPARLAADRLDRFARLIARTPGEANRRRLRALLEGGVPARVLMRELVPDGPSRADGVPALAGVLHRLEEAGIGPGQGGALAREVEDALLDVLRRDVLGVRRPLADRVDHLVRTCAKVPLAPGRCRDFVADVLRRALAAPDFADAYRQRFGEAEGRDALLRLQRLLVAAGACEPAGETGG